jgi:tight adherence protein B
VTPAVSVALELAVMVLAAGLLFAYWQLGRRQDLALAKRVDRAIRIPATGRKATAPGSANRIVMASPWLRLPFAFGIRRTWGITLTTLWTMLFAVGGAIGAWLLLRGLLHLAYWSVLPGMAVAALLLPRYILLWQQRRTDARFVGEFPDSIDMIVRMVRSGLPVAAAIRTVSQKASPTIATVFGRIADRCDIGIPLEEALSDMSEELGLADFRFFAVTLALQRTTGGNLARTLETFGEIIRKRRAIRLKAVAATAEVRMSAMVLGGLPFAVVGILAVINPGYLAPMLSDPRGNVMIAAAVMSLVLGVGSMRWLVRSGTLT